MLEEFKKYVNNYDMNDEKIKLKYEHCLRVMELSKKYAQKLGFSEEDIELATIIGLLHDFGRFEQLRVYNSFVDRETIDHADYSVEQLFDKGQIINYTSKKEYYEIIKFAIQNHNKCNLVNVSDERMMMHARLIRDTDKLDIIYLLGKLGQLNQKAINEPITEEIIEGIRKYELVDRKREKNSNDELALIFAFAFDVYNDICLPEMKQNIEDLYKQIDGEEIFKEVYQIIMEYIDNRINRKEE